MATPFETFITTELPLRPALLTYEITGYQGDPNDPGAPAILQGAPKGTFYLRNSDNALWRKATASSTSWLDMSSGGSAALWYVQEWTATDGQTVFLLDYAVGSAESFSFHVNGVEYDNGADFTRVGQTVTWLNTQFVIGTGDFVVARYQRS